MPSTNRPRPAIYLVYDASKIHDGNATRALGSVNAFSREWKQLELLSDAKPDSLVFIRPDSGDIFQTLKRLHVKHVVDMRDVPYLNFSTVNRHNFFDQLAEIYADYIGMHELMHKVGAASVAPLFRDKSQGREFAIDDPDLVGDALSERIGDGPTAVFCDSNPKEDSKVGAFLDFLSKRKIKHAPVLAVDDG